MRERLFCFFLSVVFVFIGVLPACAVKVGIVLPLTGAEAKYGEIEKKSFEMAIEEINKVGGVKGEKIELVIRDDVGRAEVGRSAAETLISRDKVVMIGGGFGSSVAYAVADLCEKKKKPFLVNTAAADRITSSGWDYVFRISPSASEYWGAVESLLAEVIKPKTIAILYENSSVQKTGARFFEEVCKKSGYTVVLKQSYEFGTIDFKPLLLKVKQLNPDIVCMMSRIMDAALLMNQSRELKLTPRMFMGGAVGFAMPEFHKSTGAAADCVISAALWHQSLNYPGTEEYFNHFRARYKSDADCHGLKAYAAAYVIADALKRSRSWSGEDIRIALSATDMTTVFGPVKFTSYGAMKNQNKAASYVVQWIDGKLELVWPPQVASRKFAYPVDWLTSWRQ
jgi:branched-chain amino acid transport system substrate-binding protein